MGNNACGCGSNQRNKPIVFDVNNQDWADAVNTLNMAGVRMLHQQDPDLINECINVQGHIAIHVAVKKQHFELFAYLLKFGADINRLRADDGNSPLHLAVINKDLRIIRELFNCDVDDTLLNNQALTAEALIDDTYFRRKYIKIKNHHKSNYHRYSQQQQQQQQQAVFNRMETRLPTSIGGMIVSNMSNQQLQQVLYDANADPAHQSPPQKQRQREYSHPSQSQRVASTSVSGRHCVSNVSDTAFGEEVGCDIDEIAHFVQRINQENKLCDLWDKWVKKKKITKQQDLAKVIYGLTVLTLRNRYKQHRDLNAKPATEPIKNLTSTIYKMLPSYKSSTKQEDSDKYARYKKQRHVLSRQEFVAHFHSYLHRAHTQFVKQEMERHSSRKIAFTPKLEKIL